MKVVDLVKSLFGYGGQFFLLTEQIFATERFLVDLFQLKNLFTHTQTQGCNLINKFLLSVYTDGLHNNYIINYYY